MSVFSGTPARKRRLSTSTESRLFSKVLLNDICRRRRLGSRAKVQGSRAPCWGATVSVTRNLSRRPSKTDPFTARAACAAPAA
jgi:hypothetical protein